MPQAPDELQRRIAILADESEQGADFDRASWFWLLMLGLIGPIVFIIVGWFA